MITAAARRRTLRVVLQIDPGVCSRRWIMVRGMALAAVALLMAATSVDAGLFSRSNGCAAPVVVSGCGDSSCNSCCNTRKVKVRKVKRSRCCEAAPSCCAPAPAPSCCAPAAPVCAAPAPTCCAPAPTCCAPAPTACGCAAPTGYVGSAAAGVAAPPPADGALGEAPKPMAVETPAPPK